MKKLLHAEAGSSIRRMLLLGWFTLFVGMVQIMAQVSFTQTTNADFYKGNYNDLIVESDNVYLPYQATDLQTWLTTTVLPQTLEGHKTATWNSRYVYVVGGYNDLTYSNAVYRATIQTGGISSYTTLNPLPVGLRDHAVVIGTNTIYVLGGRDDTSIYDAIHYATINPDGSIGDWQTSAVTLPATLWGHTAVYSNGYIYVAGGATTMTATEAKINVYYAKVLADNTLSAFFNTTNLPQARNGHSMVAQGDKVYVIAGFTTGGTKRNTVYFATSSASGALGGWAAATALPISVSNHSSVVMNGLLTVMAGESGGTLVNTVYYADITATPLVWTLSPNVMYDRTKDGAAYAGNGQIGYCGGENLSGDPIHNTRYAGLTLSTNYKKTGFFIGNTFYELGAERVITELNFAVTALTGASVEVSYRTAGNDGNWGSWSAATPTSPIPIGLTKRFLQYKVIFSSNGTVNGTLHSMTLVTPGTQLTGNLNTWTNFSLAQSPYWVTGDISFTGGTHTFEAGVILNFLPETGMTVGQANIICNGTAADSVKFVGYIAAPGIWDGIYFDPNSDNGVSSQFNYTVIAHAGFGSNNANLYCNASSEPLLNRCRLRDAEGHGIRLNGAHINMEFSNVKNNTENGLYLENSNPTFVTCDIGYNSAAGIGFSSSASVPTYSGTTIHHNLYGMYYPSPNHTIYPPNGSPTLSSNTYNGICLAEGTVSSNQVWNSIAYDYIMLGDVSIGAYASVCRLTIEPGNTIKYLPGKTFQVGYHTNYYYGGELYAIGTSDSTITFTSFNGTSGGWEGIYFQDNSDWSGASSVMDYCTVEKGNNYNVLVENTTTPLMLNCVFRNAVTDGVKCYNAFNSIETSTFSNNGRYPLFFAEPLTLPTLNGNTYTGNGINLIGFSGGTISENRTMQYDGIGYHILDNITIGRYAEVRRLTIEPGVNLYFDPGKMIQAGYHTSYYYGGELYAEGTAGMPITFTPYNGVAGSWNGIYFHDNSDWNGATNSLQYCVVEKANDYNIYCDNTGSVTIDNCIIRDAVTDGLRYNASYGSFSNNVFGNNGRYPVYMMDWTSQPVHNDNTFNSKGINYIALSGGTYTESRTITADNAEYLVLGDILIGKYANINRLTIKPGVTLNFDLNTNIQVGYHSGYYYGGELYAEGNTDSLIVFRPYNGVAGGWDGIYFHDNSDWNGATSSLRFCRIEKGSGYNVFSENTSQPTLTDSYLTGSAGEGMRMNNASPVIRTIDFTNNAGHGIFLDGSSNPDIGNDPSYTCNLYLNGLYNVYNNTTNNIDARNNYWGTGDSAMIAQTIYDRYDNTAKGIVIFADFAQIPSLPATTTLLSGDVWYSNSVSTAMTNAQMQIFDFGGIPIASTVTNSLGHYAFAPFTSGNYTLTITPSDPWGGVNSTDGLLILNHFAKIDTLENMKLAAADVNASATINGTDALLVMRRYAGHISSFATGDWLYNSASLTINGNQVVNDFEMLCFGDVNSSYVPTDGDGGSVLLVYEGTQVIGSFSDFTVDVRIKEMIQAGAVSFGLFYPEEYMEVTGAQLLNTSGNVIFTAADGLTRIAWADLNPLTLQQDEVMIRLECQAKDLTGLLEPIYLELYPNTEFANPAGTVYQDVTLTVPGLVTLMTAVPTRTLDGLWLAKNYPNPFNESTTISYNIPTDGHVSIRVMSLTGTEVALVVDDYQTGGSYTVDFSSTGLEPGIYLYELVFGNSGGNYSIVNKMSVTR